MEITVKDILKDNKDIDLKNVSEKLKNVVIFDDDGEGFNIKKKVSDIEIPEPKHTKNKGNDIFTYDFDRCEVIIALNTDNYRTITVSVESDSGIEDAPEKYRVNWDYKGDVYLY